MSSSIVFMLDVMRMKKIETQMVEKKYVCGGWMGGGEIMGVRRRRLKPAYSRVADRRQTTTPGITSYQSPCGVNRPPHI